MQLVTEAVKNAATEANSFYPLGVSLTPPLSRSFSVYVDRGDFVGRFSLSPRRILFCRVDARKRQRVKIKYNTTDSEGSGTMWGVATCLRPVRMSSGPNPGLRWTETDSR